ncbi:YihY/virulence factor BrkB family protein [Metamycoplasma buccale]|uniref:YihY/virulence factor BrkB family protein n=1 Tax=Metamycoplasma buccale TaxID=55602 RepID=UPI00398EC124
MCRRKRNNKLRTGWDAQEKNSQREQLQINSNQVIENKHSKNIIERIVKWFIYIILFIAIPHKIKNNKTKGKEIVNNTYKKFNSREFAFIPAGNAMYLFLSFIPISCLLISVIGPIKIEYNIVLRYAILGRIIPGVQDTLPDMTSIWKNAGGAITFVLFAVSVIWFSSKGYSKFVFSVDALYEHKTPLHMVLIRIKGVVISVILTIFLTALLLSFTAFMSFLMKEAGFSGLSTQEEYSKVKLVSDLKLRWEFWLIYYFTIVLTLPIFTYLSILLFFKFAPSFKIKFSHIHPGALIASIPISIFILIFGSLTSIIRYDKFGPVATFMYLILLVSLMSYFIYIGVIVNSSYYKTFINLPTINKRSIFEGRKIRV